MITHGYPIRKFCRRVSNDKLLQDVIDPTPANYYRRLSNTVPQDVIRWEAVHRILSTM